MYSTHTHTYKSKGVNTVEFERRKDLEAVNHLKVTEEEVLEALEGSPPGGRMFWLCLLPARASDTAVALGGGYNSVN